MLEDKESIPGLLEDSWQRSCLISCVTSTAGYVGSLSPIWAGEASKEGCLVEGSPAQPLSIGCADILGLVLPLALCLAETLISIYGTSTPPNLLTCFVQSCVAYLKDWAYKMVLQFSIS